MSNTSNFPREDSIDLFLAALSSHNKISHTQRRLGTFVVDVVLQESGMTLAVFMTNIYCVGEGDVLEILRDFPDVDAIVTLSSWNMVSTPAARFGAERVVGVFTWKDFFGAINYRQFWLYEPIPFNLKPHEVDRERRRRRDEWN